jgi:predicted alpha/beta hydrolase family esterase
MKKRVFIVFGWEGYPEEGWFPWLRRELEQRGFEVSVPNLPDSENPRIYNWVPALREAVGQVDEQTYFIGHSIGCQAIARFLEMLPGGKKVGGAVFVAGFFKHLKGLEDDADVQETDKHWLTAPLDLEKVHSHLPKSIAIFSSDDPWVPLDNQDDFGDKLGSEIIIQEKAGHFSGNMDQCFELPIALESLLKLSN